MRQRAMIAMSIANSPALLIADEPTTALDVTIQAQVLEVLKTVQDETNAATILITHDLGIVAELCDRVARHVRRPDRRVAATCTRSSRSPRHPYTIGLMDSLPKLTEDEEWLRADPGRAAVAHQPAVRLCVPSPVLPLGGPGACREEVPGLRRRTSATDQRPRVTSPRSSSGAARSSREPWRRSEFTVSAHGAAAVAIDGDPPARGAGRGDPPHRRTRQALPDPGRPPQAHGRTDPRRRRRRSRR